MRQCASRPRSKCRKTRLPPSSPQHQSSSPFPTFLPRLFVRVTTCSIVMPGASPAWNITALATWPSGDAPAFLITRTARLNCSSSQKTIALAAKARPARP
jgi:hypothetical protein